jgi:hypothetical protein
LAGGAAFFAGTTFLAGTGFFAAGFLAADAFLAAGAFFATGFAFAADFFGLAFAMVPSLSILDSAINQTVYPKKQSHNITVTDRKGK